MWSKEENLRKNIIRYKEEKKGGKGTEFVQSLHAKILLESEKEKTEKTYSFLCLKDQVTRVQGSELIANSQNRT